jgi:chaperone required for assembly of F1-ATPase
MEAAEKPRRFYHAVSVEPADGGFQVALDGRSPRSPGRQPLKLPTAALAEAVADEWRAQTTVIDLAAMPMTRLAYTVLDRSAEARIALSEEVGRYAGSDLLCYLAEGPESLIAREQAAWDPWREWAALELELPLLCTAGIAPLAQPPASVERAEQLALDLDDFALTGLAYAVALLGSAVLGFAVQRGALSAEEAFAASRIDETFQEERWGVDEEAAARTERRRQDALMIGRWFEGLRG